MLTGYSFSLVDKTYEELNTQGSFLVMTSKKIGEVFAPREFMAADQYGQVLSYRRYDYTLAYTELDDRLYWLPEPSEIRVKLGSSGQIVYTQSGPKILRKGNPDTLDMDYVMVWDRVSKSALKAIELAADTNPPMLVSPDPLGMILSLSTIDLEVEPIKGSLNEYRVTLTTAALKAHVPGLLYIPPNGSFPATDWATDEFIQIQSTAEASNGVWIRQKRNQYTKIKGNIAYPGIGALAVAFLDGTPNVIIGTDSGQPYMVLAENQLTLGDQTTYDNFVVGQAGIGVVMFGYDVLKQTIYAMYSSVHADKAPKLVKVRASMPADFKVPNTVYLANGTDSYWRPVSGRLGWPYEFSEGLASYLLQLAIEETGSWRLAHG